MYQLSINRRQGIRMLTALAVGLLCTSFDSIAQIPGHADCQGVPINSQDCYKFAVPNDQWTVDRRLLNNNPTAAAPEYWQTHGIVTNATTVMDHGAGINCTDTFTGGSVATLTKSFNVGTNNIASAAGIQPDSTIGYVESSAAAPNPAFTLTDYFMSGGVNSVQLCADNSMGGVLYSYGVAKKVPAIPMLGNGTYLAINPSQASNLHTGYEAQAWLMRHNYAGVHSGSFVGTMAHYLRCTATDGSFADFLTSFMGSGQNLATQAHISPFIMYGQRPVNEMLAFFGFFPDAGVGAGGVCSDNINPCWHHGSQLTYNHLSYGISTASPAVVATCREWTGVPGAAGSYVNPQIPPVNLHLYQATENLY